jgi:hypothetical protein
MKGDHDIYIVEAGGHYRVRPAAWSVNPKKKNSSDKAIELLIRNMTKCKVIVAFPDIVDMTVAGAATEFALQPVGATNPAKDRLDRRIVPLKSDTNADCYPYSVFVVTSTGTVQAVGESEPVVIIDPPPA